MAMYGAEVRRERQSRANFIEDVATAVWGGKDATARVKALRQGN
jgi:hypothetical protein